MGKRTRFGQHTWRKFKTVTGGRVQTKITPGVTTANPCNNIRGNPCSSKLAFLNAKNAKNLGTSAGANLVYCLGEKKIGAVVPVSSAKEATELGRKYCACVREGGSASTCGAPAAFKGYGRHRRKRR